jgi:probable H4MPT-linked C1 transfer pathway protein
MSPRDFVGWDLGGAHLKAAQMDAQGRVLSVLQLPCPLWQGLDTLLTGIDEVVDRLECSESHHAITMTGELVDLFSSRVDGVRTLSGIMAERLAHGTIQLFAGSRGFLGPADVCSHEEDIASNNWLASASFVARRLPQAMFIDIGSTTTDVAVIHRGRVAARGSNDNERLRCGELLYTGVVRTPLMALAGKAPFAGEWVPLMAENFAVTADIYRLTGELPEHADILASADNAAKTAGASATRLARMLGLDLDAGSLAQWRQLAWYFSRQQLHSLEQACDLAVARNTLPDDAPLAGAGVGRFLVERLAQRLGRPYVDLQSLINTELLLSGDPADCTPAVAVADLARRALGDARC